MQLYPTPAPPLSLKPRRKYLWTVWENPYSNPIVINKDWDDFIKKIGNLQIGMEERLYFLYPLLLYYFVFFVYTTRYLPNDSYKDFYSKVRWNFF